jgi:hypothetical protein
MAHNILKSKTGKIVMGGVVLFIFIIGLLWINGKHKRTVPETQETVSMKIPKSKPIAKPDFQEPLETSVPEVVVPDPSMMREETPQELQEDLDTSETVIGSVETVNEPEIKPEEIVSSEPDISTNEIEENQKPADDDKIVQEVTPDAHEEEVVVTTKEQLKEAAVVPPAESESETKDPIQAMDSKTDKIITAQTSRKKEESAPQKQSVSEADGQAFILHEIRMSENMKGKILEIWANKAIRKYRYFTLSNPPRLVIDLPGNWKEPEFHSKAIENDLILKIRLWRHAKKLRIVNDLLSDQAINPVVTPNSEGVEFLLVTE